MADEKIRLIQQKYKELEYEDNIHYGGIIIKYQHVCEVCVEGYDINKQKLAVEKVIGQMKRKEEKEVMKNFDGEKRSVYTLQNNYVIVLLVCDIRFPPNLAMNTLKNIYSFFYSSFKKSIEALDPSKGSPSYVNLDEFDSFRPKLLDLIMKANNDEFDETRATRKKMQQFLTTTEVSVGKIYDRGEKVAVLRKQADNMKQASVDLNAVAIEVERQQRCRYLKKKMVVIILLVILVVAVIGTIVGVCYQFIPRSNNTK